MESHILHLDWRNYRIPTDGDVPDPAYEPGLGLNLRRDSLAIDPDLDPLPDADPID